MMKTRFRRLTHRLFFTLLALVTLVTLFYAEENWRGARVWAAVKRDLAARGESTELKTFIPPPVPDDQNLAMAPLFVRAFRYRPDPTNGVLTFEPYNPHNPTLDGLGSMFFGPTPPKDAHYPRGNARWTNGHHRDLTGWQTFYRENPALPRAPQPQSPPEDVLLALSRAAPLLDELSRAAAERPLTRFPINWTYRPISHLDLHHLNTVRVIIYTLGLRASARLAVGDVPAARQDLDLAFQITRALSDEPLLISSLEESSAIETLLQPIWEGLEARQWTASDLTALQAELERFDLLRSLRNSFRTERAAYFVQMMEDFQNPALASDTLSQFGVDRSDPPPDTFWGAVRWTFGLPKSPELAVWNCLFYFPRGWFAQNAALGCRLHQVELIDRLDLSRGFVHLETTGEDHQVLDHLPLWPTTFLAKRTVPTFGGLPARFARTQAILNEGVTALALERFYQDHQTYPPAPALAALVPAYLDRVRVDPFDGAPLRYQLTVDGRFKLWSVGVDRKDDGGSLEWSANRTWRHGDPSFPRPESGKADDVWQYAPAEPPDLPNNRSRLESLR